MVAVPRFMNLQQDAAYQACKANQGTLETALEQWMSANNAYPAAADQTGMVSTGMLKKLVYCPSDTTKAATDTDYTWTVTGTGAGVVTCAVKTTGTTKADNHNL